MLFTQKELSPSKRERLKDYVYDIIGYLFEVYKELPCGLPEYIYQEALEIELRSQGIPFEREKEFDVFYKSEKLDKKYRVDFLCYNKIIVELKAVTEMRPEFQAQTLNYMKMSKIKLGLLVNFGLPKLEIQRLVRMQGW